jgi:hypothetical protein
MARHDSTVAVMKRHGTEVTLDNWLGWNGIDPDDPPDGELLEILPEQFREEYYDRCRFYSEYENKFNEHKLRGRKR